MAPRLRFLNGTRRFILGFLFGITCSRLRDAADIVGDVKDTAMASMKEVNVNMLEGWLQSKGMYTTGSTLSYVKKWPQKDNRIETAIRQGMILNMGLQQDNMSSRHFYECEMHNASMTQCEAPPRGLATVVTSYYYMKSKHSWRQYREWLSLMLSGTDPMVVFVQPNTGWTDIVRERRKHAPTIIVQMPFEQFTMGSTFSDEFWETEVAPTDPDPEFPLTVGVNVYKMWNEKIILMNEVSKVNPFNTEHIFWIDAGYYRRITHAPNYKPIVRNNVTANGVKREQVAFQNVFENPKEYEIAGGAWGGTPSALSSAYDRYFETFWWMVVNKYDCVGYEQRIMLLMCKRFPALCNVQMHKSESDWFAMGRDWLRSAKYDFSKPFHLEHNETSVVQPVPFPLEGVIHSLRQYPTR